MAQTGVRRGSSTKVDGHVRADSPGGSWHACPCPLLTESGSPHLGSDTPLPTSPIPATLGVGRQLGQASACGSPGHKRQAGDRSTEFFKALMESASQDLGPGTQGMSQGPLPQHCSCFVFQILRVTRTFLGAFPQQEMRHEGPLGKTWDWGTVSNTQRPPQYPQP